MNINRVPMTPQVVNSVLSLNVSLFWNFRIFIKFTNYPTFWYLMDSDHFLIVHQWDVHVHTQCVSDSLSLKSWSFLQIEILCRLLAMFVHCQTPTNFARDFVILYFYIFFHFFCC